MIGKKRLDRPYCSLGCRDEAYRLNPPVPRQTVYINCGNCGAAIQSVPSLSSRKKFCSRRCAAVGRPLNGRPSKIATAAAELVVQATGLLATAELRVSHWSIDLAFPVEMIALELDGEYWHGLPKAATRDAKKDAALTQRGWRVLRIPIEKRDTPESLANKATAALAPLIPAKPYPVRR